MFTIQINNCFYRSKQVINNSITASFSIMIDKLSSLFSEKGYNK